MSNEKITKKERMLELDKRIKNFEKTLETGVNQNTGEPVKREHVTSLTATLMLLKKQKRNDGKHFKRIE
jgi:hypothetical protein